jgi:hypothetical protein
MQEDAKQLRDKLKEHEDDRTYGITVKKALNYASKLPDIEEDILRRYLDRIKWQDNMSRRSMSSQNYDCKVLTSTESEGDHLKYDIIDVTSLDVGQMGVVEAKLIDVTSIEAGEIRTDILDATSVTSDNVQAKKGRFVTSTETFKEKAEKKRERRREKEKERQRIQEKHDELEKQGKHPEDVAHRLADMLKNEYWRPPRPRDGKMYEVDKRGGTVTEIIMHVGHNRPFRRGNSMHSGKWVIIRYSARYGRWSVLFKRDGVAGNSDKRRTFNLGEADEEVLKECVNSFLSPKHVRNKVGNILLGKNKEEEENREDDLDDGDSLSG